jgi:malonate transporter MadM subunit
MSTMTDLLEKVVSANGIIIAFVFVGLITVIASGLSKYLTAGRVHGSAFAIAIGLLLAWWGGTLTGGTRGIADVPFLAGVGVLGGAMFRDFAIVATAFGADLRSLRRAGWVGALSVVLGVVLSFTAGAVIAVAFGYTDSVAITTIGAGAATYIVGPVTGTALGASSEVIALSVAAGLTKSILVMIATPLVAARIGLTTPQAALVYGGLMGTTSGVAAGLAATDQKLVPYGAMTATFYTGLGCLLAPSILFFIVQSLV